MHRNVNTIASTRVVQWQDTNLFGIRKVTWVLPEVQLVIMQSRAQVRVDKRAQQRIAIRIK